MPQQIRHLLWRQRLDRAVWLLDAVDEVGGKQASKLYPYKCYEIMTFDKLIRWVMKAREFHLLITNCPISFYLSICLKYIVVL